MSSRAFYGVNFSLTDACEIAVEEGYSEARDGMLADMARGCQLGTHGTITWNRDSLHEPLTPCKPSLSTPTS
jgi:hypothetical protein